MVLLFREASELEDPLSRTMLKVKLSSDYWSETSLLDQLDLVSVDTSVSRINTITSRLSTLDR